ncbi:MAG: hypothetical protein H0X51_09590 [Parachlamydiaceae bacterium]|nr:hypothetical protein [Parachlamydiaceae bacterium]
MGEVRHSMRDPYESQIPKKPPEKDSKQAKEKEADSGPVLEAVSGKQDIDVPLWKIGKAKPASEANDRIRIRSLNYDSGFLIRKMDVPRDEWRVLKWMRTFRWVKVSEGGREYYLNIGSLRKRLLVTSEELSELRGRAGLQALQEKATKLRHAMDKYSTQFEKYDSLRSTNRIVPSLLCRTVLYAHNLWLGSDIAGDPKKGVVAKESGKEYLVHTDGTTAYVCHLSSEHHLGSGGFGKVHQIEDLANRKFYAIKRGKNVLREGENLQRLEKLKVVGVQRAPIVATVIRTSEGLEEIMIGHLYGMPQTHFRNLTDLINTKILTQPELGTLCDKLLTNLFDMQAKGLYHGDLKGGNVFVSEGEDGGIELSTGDWASMQELDKVKHSNEYTGLYRPIIHGEMLRGQYPAERALGARCHDRFATGCMLFETLTARDAFEMGENEMALPVSSGDARQGGREDVQTSFPEGRLRTEILKKQGVCEDGIAIIQLMANLKAPKNLKAYNDQMAQIKVHWEAIKARPEGWFAAAPPAA